MEANVEFPSLHSDFEDRLTDGLREFFGKLYETFSRGEAGQTPDTAVWLKEFIMRKTLPGLPRLFGFDEEYRDPEPRLFAAQAYAYYMRFCGLAIDLIDRYDAVSRSLSKDELSAMLEHCIFRDRPGELAADGLAFGYNVPWHMKKTLLFRCGHIFDNVFKYETLYDAARDCLNHLQDTHIITAEELEGAKNHGLPNPDNADFGEIFNEDKLGKNGVFGMSRLFGRCVLKYSDSQSGDGKYRLWVTARPVFINCTYKEGRGFSPLQAEDGQTGGEPFCDSRDNFLIDFSDFRGGRDKGEASLSGLFERAHVQKNGGWERRVSAVYDCEVVVKNKSGLPLKCYELTKEQMQLMLLMYYLITENIIAPENAIELLKDTAETEPAETDPAKTDPAETEPAEIFKIMNDAGYFDIGSLERKNLPKLDRETYSGDDTFKEFLRSLPEVIQNALKNANLTEA